MDFNLGSLQTIGIVLCVGGILLVLLIAFAARSLFGRRNPQQMDRNDERVLRDRGEERPRYDSDEVQSRGGFGNAPSTSRRTRDRDFGETGLPATGRRALDDDDRRTTGPETGDRLQNYRRGQDQEPSSRSRQRDDDDDEVRSRGGFGG